ncbi:MAG: hypothetical protein AAFZ89_16400 [Bacteroidota bacterium]
MRKGLFIVLKVYLFTWVLFFVLFLLRALDESVTLTEAFQFFLELMGYTTFLTALHLAFLVIYLLFLIGRYFHRTYIKKGFSTMAKQAAFRFLLPTLAIFVIFKLLVYGNSNENYAYAWDHTIENRSRQATNLYKTDGKHRGMSVFGWKEHNEKYIDELIKNNIEWVAITPFYYQKGEDTREMGIPNEIGKWSQRDSVFIKSIAQLHAKGVRVQLKPHLWMDQGWRSNVKMPNKEAWSLWFESYRKNLIHHAIMAQETGVELLCIGTELKSSLRHAPEQWWSLVREIKTVYKGKLTYAANWDGEYELVDFWGELDYIGIQAYFPLTKTKNPNLEMIKTGWDRHVQKLHTLYKTHEKPILFTEVGYKSEASATIKPWEWGTTFGILFNKKSDRTQQRAYEALFNRLWDKDWFHGTYIWQWDTRTSEDDAFQSVDFSPRYKPAENTIAKWYGSVGTN